MRCQYIIEDINMLTTVNSVVLHSALIRRMPLTIVSYHIVSYRIISHHAISYQIISCHIISHCTVSHRIISNHIKSHLLDAIAT